MRQITQIEMTLKTDSAGASTDNDQNFTVQLENSTVQLENSTASDASTDQKRPWRFTLDETTVPQAVRDAGEANYQSIVLQCTYGTEKLVQTFPLQISLKKHKFHFQNKFDISIGENQQLYGFHCQKNNYYYPCLDKKDAPLPCGNAAISFTCTYPHLPDKIQLVMIGDPRFQNTYITSNPNLTDPNFVELYVFDRDYETNITALYRNPMEANTMQTFAPSTLYYTADQLIALSDSKTFNRLFAVGGFLFTVIYGYDKKMNPITMKIQPFYSQVPNQYQTFIGKSKVTELLYTGLDDQNANVSVVWNIEK
jgi:hypothetical protein